jgi:hypothetical protein
MPLLKAIIAVINCDKLFQRNNSDEYDGFFNMDTGADDIEKVSI